MEKPIQSKNLETQLSSGCGPDGISSGFIVTTYPTLSYIPAFIVTSLSASHKPFLAGCHHFFCVTSIHIVYTSDTRKVID